MRSRIKDVFRYATRTITTWCIKNMFKEHYINEDIGGTVDSIKEITKEKTIYSL